MRFPINLWGWRSHLGHGANLGGQVSGYIENEEGEEEFVEIFEYWSVSDWFADKLIEEGEFVEKDFYGLCVWGRITTGQAIALDYVTRKIVQEFGYACKYLSKYTFKFTFMRKFDTFNSRKGECYGTSTDE